MKTFWINYNLTYIGAIFRNILNVRIDKKLIFTMEDPIVTLQLFDRWKVPRRLVFRMIPDKDQTV